VGQVKASDSGLLPTRMGRPAIPSEAFSAWSRRKVWIMRFSSFSSTTDAGDKLPQRSIPRAMMAGSQAAALRGLANGGGPRGREIQVFEAKWVFPQNFVEAGLLQGAGRPPKLWLPVEAIEEKTRPFLFFLLRLFRIARATFVSRSFPGISWSSSTTSKDEAWNALRA